MKKHIHCYISDKDMLDGAINVNINEMKNIANGSCDYVSFNEINSLPSLDIEAVIAGLSKKIKLNTGRLVLEYLNFDRVVNDIIYNKLSIDQINSIITNKASFIYENTMDQILDNQRLKLEHIIYNDFTTQISIIRHE